MLSGPKSRKNKLSTETDRADGATNPPRDCSTNLTRLRYVLSAVPTPAVYMDEDCGEGSELIPAAVLFSIVLRDDGPSVLLTQRNADLKDHPGQISFPGGRVEETDLSLAHTALREAEEEIGLDPKCVEVVGYLPEYRTITGFCVTPVVAIVTPPISLRPDPSEVAEVFEVPLSFLMNPANHQQHTIQFRGQLRDYHAVPYGDRFIWGATAGIILGLSRLLVG